MAPILNTYADFIARVETLGFMALSPILPGLPSLGDETLKSHWHTGQDNDPWLWKDRAAEEQRLAYGCILGGYKGFVAQRMYPIFYAAFHPETSMPERWMNGTVNQITWQLWQLFEARRVLNTSQIRQIIGVKFKSALDTATQKLQREYYITIDGNERKISAKGEFYGWPVNRYRQVVDWVPEGWLEEAKYWSAETARELILDEGVANSEGVNRQKLAQKFGWR